jgi:hypothetical protein
VDSYVSPGIGVGGLSSSGYVGPAEAQRLPALATGVLEGFELRDDWGPLEVSLGDGSFVFLIGVLEGMLRGLTGGSRYSFSKRDDKMS